MKYTPTFSTDEKQMDILYLKLGGNGLIYVANQVGASPSADTAACAIATTHLPCTTAVTEEDLTPLSLKIYRSVLPGSRERALRTTPCPLREQ